MKRLVSCVLWMAVSLLAQGDRGTIAGTINDPTGRRRGGRYGHHHQRKH